MSVALSYFNIVGVAATCEVVVVLELAVLVAAVALGGLGSGGGGSEGATGLSNWVEPSVTSWCGRACKLGVTDTIGRQIIPL